MCAGDGETYERSAIERYIHDKQEAMDIALNELQDTDGESKRAIRILKTGITSPMGNGKLKTTMLVPNQDKKRDVNEWRQENGI